MTDERHDTLFDLLAKQAIEGLDNAELVQLKALAAELDYDIDDSFEIAASAVALSGMDEIEPMPEHLRAKVLSSADAYFGTEQPEHSPVADANAMQPTFEFKPKRSFFGWLGWAVAAAACVALAVNIWFSRQQTQGPTVAGGPTPTASPAKPDIKAQFDEMMASPNMVKATWGPMPTATGDMKNVSGEVVWSDAKQAGFMRFRGLPVTDKTKEQYQLWIFENAKLEEHPKDGGVFDITADGDVIIPIDAKLAAKDPKIFAITVEKPGGVVVSDRKKIAALAKVETVSS
ncbi:MAG TPA: anti-sigma factor [Pyrinomonadaceae bacterium]|nr:anti-sigma factor [Pyrinomonadaceae bacterium]